MAMDPDTPSATLAHLSELEEIYDLIHDHGAHPKALQTICSKKKPGYSLARLKDILAWFKLIGIEDDPGHSNGGSCTSSCTRFKANLDRDISRTLSAVSETATTSNATDAESEASVALVNNGVGSTAPFRKLGTQRFFFQQWHHENQTELEYLAQNGTSMRDIILHFNGLINAQAVQRQLSDRTLCPPITDDIGPEFHEKDALVFSTAASESMLRMKEEGMSLQQIGRLMGIDLWIVPAQLAMAEAERQRQAEWGQIHSKPEIDVKGVVQGTTTKRRKLG